MNVTRRVCLLWVLLLSIAAPVAGRQLDSVAALRGRVLDPQARGIVARVRVVQVSPGLERDTESDAAGRFALTSIPPGDIDVIASAPGFADRRIQGVRLEVGQAAEVEIAL